MKHTYSRTNFFQEEKRAKKKSDGISKEPFRPEIDTEHQILPKDEYDYIFALQGWTAKGLDRNGNRVRETKMDYYQYARDMWQELVDPTGNFEHPAFTQFQKDLISGLHNIEMQDLVYEDVRNSMDTLIRKLEPVISKAILWSKGDVSTTGYQVLKIKSSQIILDTIAKTKEILGAEEGAKQFRERTEYMVADDKIQMILNYLEAKKNAGEKSVKLAIIEDTRGNIDRVTAAVEDLFGENGEVVPIWATYSREGMTHKSQLEAGSLSPEEIEDIDQHYIKIERFTELAEPHMLARLEGSELIIDFDGVIGDNVRMRNAQSQVTAAALRKGKAIFHS